eukprot:12207107-Alexandrium_andersonii.AAC.1
MCRIVNSTDATLKEALAQARKDQELRSKFFIAPMALAAGPEARRGRDDPGRRADQPARNETGANAPNPRREDRKRGREDATGSGNPKKEPRDDKAKRARN